MSKAGKILLGVAVVLVGAGAIGLKHMLDHGFSARDKPTEIEKVVARRLRYLSIPSAQARIRNPVLLTPGVLERARAHFADHCALCHGNDGRGKTAIGQNLYPKPPDMTLQDTQGLPDGALFYIIKNGVRLTGMPAWGDNTPEDDRESWELVHFIRHLPRLSGKELAQMDELNPRSQQEWEEEQAEKRFLAGGDATSPSSNPKQQPERKEKEP